MLTYKPRFLLVVVCIFLLGSFLVRAGLPPADARSDKVLTFHASAWNFLPVVHGQVSGPAPTPTSEPPADTGDVRISKMGVFAYPPNFPNLTNNLSVFTLFASNNDRHWTWKAHTHPSTRKLAFLPVVSFQMNYKPRNIPYRTDYYKLLATQVSNRMEQKVSLIFSPKVSQNP
jgi:hypothetical protein